MLAAGILMAGTDTTRNQVAAALDVFCDYPEQWALLAERPELAMKAVEEVMRFCPVIFGAHADDDRGRRAGGHVVPRGHLRHVQHGRGQPRRRRVRRAGALRHHPRGRPADADVRRRCALLPRRQPGQARDRLRLSVMASRMHQPAPQRHRRSGSRWSESAVRQRFPSHSTPPRFRYADVDHAADPLAREHRLQHVAHGVGALPPGELAAAGLRLAAELIAQHRIGQQPLEADHHLGRGRPPAVR